MGSVGVMAEPEELMQMQKFEKRERVGF